MTYASRPSIPVNVSQLSALTNGFTSNFWKGYDYIFSQLGSADPATRFWFSQASSINKGVDSSSYFIRTYTATANKRAAELGLSTAPPQSTQAMSDAIALAVLQDIASHGAVPDLSRILHNDIQKVIGPTNDLALWGGSFYYWDVPLLDGALQPTGQTVGSSILASPLRTKLFEESLGNTLALAAQNGTSYFSALIHPMDTGSVLSAIFQLPIDVQDKAFAIAREKSDTFRALWNLFTGDVSTIGSADYSSGNQLAFFGSAEDLAVVLSGGGGLSSDPITRQSQISRIFGYIPSVLNDNCRRPAPADLRRRALRRARTDRSRTTAAA